MNFFCSHQIPAFPLFFCVFFLCKAPSQKKAHFFIPKWPPFIHHEFMIAFFIGLLIGLILNIPIGPLNLLVVKNKLQKGFLPAFLLALSASLMDGVYFFLIFSGLSLVSFPPIFITFMQYGGPLLLLCLGLMEFFKKGENLNLEKISQQSSPSTLSKKNFLQHNYFLLGLLIYVSNPTLVATLSALATFIKSLALFPEQSFHHGLFSLGASLGSLGWFYLVIVLVHRFRHSFSPSFMQNLNRICGLLIIICGLYMGIKVYLS